ncbi:MAG: hypothetical protein ACRBHB_23595 [Arenicella sp.]
MTIKTKNFWLYGAYLFFGLYFLNVIGNKIAISLAITPFFLIGDVGEFLLLFSAVVCFVGAILDRENEIVK